MIITRDNILEHVVVVDSGCWLWKHGCDVSGYGQIHHRSGRKRTLKAHRVVYELFNGAEPSPHQFVCHTCDVPRCVNPEHLQLGTAADNARDMSARGRSRRGDNAPWAKLNSVQVRIIDHMLRRGVRNSEIGEVFGLPRQTINNIASGANWSSITGRPKPRRAKYRYSSRRDGRQRWTSGRVALPAA